MIVHTELFRTNNLDLAKKILSEDPEIPGELFWSLLFWKMPELFFLSVSKSIQISKEQLSNSLNKLILNDFNSTFNSIIAVLAKLNDLMEIQTIVPNESNSSDNITIPNLKEVIFLYSTIIYTIFQYFNDEKLFRASQGIQLFPILIKTNKTLSKCNLIYKEFDRITKKVCQINEIKCGLLKGVLSGIANQITQTPIIQQLTFE
ncbi:uncharacterized protein ELE39_001560 [Cryptosporidium sp. chipmunk genotype I]|uniref:uncharacterized protein n=1 Tax=Cryptosporidium sp. chipmunk genotype I TaxID=1280935 RepID=UPI00351A9CFC|nr:hypothetical protein ELE39_001560 [Cryptosporidium sp. chipmunk genotype I]